MSIVSYKLDETGTRIAADDTTKVQAGVEWEVTFGKFRYGNMKIDPKIY